MSRKGKSSRRSFCVAAAGLVWVLTLVLTAQREAAGASLELQLNGAADGAASFPVRTGVPIDPGELTDGENVRLMVDGAEAELQTEVLARYNDRSVKWLLLDFRATPGAKTVLEFGKDVRRKPVARTVKVAEDDTGITVDTGKLRAVIRRDGTGFPDELSLDMNGDGKYSDDERLRTAGGTRANHMDFVHTATITSLDVLSASADEGTLDPSKVQITELKTEITGPLHAVIRVAGNYRYQHVGTVTYPYANPQYRDLTPRDPGRIPFVMRLHFHRDTGIVEVQHTFIWEGDPDRDFPKDLALAAPMPTTADTVLTVGTDGGTVTVVRGTLAAVGLSQTSADHFEVWKSAGDGVPATVVEGRRAPGWMDVSNGRWGVTAAVWRSWQNYPKGVHAELSSDRLCVLLWPPEAGLMSLRRYTRDWGVGETGARGGVDPFALSRHASRGAAKTHRVLFDFHPGRRPAAQVSPDVAWFLQKPYAWPSCDTLCSTRAGIGTAVSPPEPGQYDDLEKIIDGCFNWMLFNQEHFRWYGMFDYGDLQQCFQNVHHHGRWESDYGRWGWFNGDASGNKPYAALMTHFLRTRRRDIFDFYEAEILHIIDVDTVNSEEYPWNDEGWRDMRGCGHRHNAQHWACFFVGSRAMRTHYFAELYYLTGDERLRDVLDISAAAAWKELAEGRAGRGGHSGTQDMTTRLFYTLERTGDRKVYDLIREKWSWMLNSNRGAAELAAAAAEEDDLEWVRRPAEAALTAKRDYRYPGTVVGGLANGIRYLKDKEDVERYREALDKAVDFMRGRFRAGPQGLPPDQWPGPPAGPIQGNWNAIPNHMPLAIHALKLHDAVRKGGGQ